MRLGDVVLSFCIGFLFDLVLATAAYSHRITLDPFGCHQNRERGTYHCHRGKFAGQEFKSKVEMLRQLQLGKGEAEKRKGVAEGNIRDYFKELNHDRGKYADWNAGTLPSMFVVTVRETPIYARPDEGSAVVARARKGEKLYSLSQVIGTAGVWYMVRTEDGKFGWVRAPRL